MATGTARVQVGVDGYRIAVGEEVTDFYDFGEVCEVELGGKRYLAFVDLPEGVEVDGETVSEDVESKLEYWLYEVTPVEGEPEDVEGDEDGEEDADTDGNGDDGDED